MSYHSPTHPKLRDAATKEPPVPPGLLKKHGLGLGLRLVTTRVKSGGEESDVSTVVGCKVKDDDHHSSGDV
jgi:hypothetical protein